MDPMKPVAKGTLYREPDGKNYAMVKLYVDAIKPQDCPVCQQETVHGILNCDNIICTKCFGVRSFCHGQGR